MFVDTRTIQVKAGDGGNGNVSFSSAYGPKRKPYGGTGGTGGNVYLVGTTSRYDLHFLKEDIVYEAESGKPGYVNNQTGADGKDRIIQVPLVTHVYDEVGTLIARIDTPDEKVLIAKGKQGGLGNYYFRTEGLGSLYKSTPGGTSDIEILTFVLELYADVIFIGYPNAGKSSILRELTNADAKVAPYAFTTIDPQQGRMDGLTLLDLPGLIEGTAEGKGVGTKFVKHTRSSKIVAHMISVDCTDLEETYTSMRKELERIGENLDSKPEIVVLTKADLIEPEEREPLRKKMEEIVQKHGHKDTQVLMVSLYDLEALEKLKNGFKEIFGKEEMIE